MEFDALAADVDLSLLIKDDDFGHLSGEALSIVGDNAAGSTETITIDMANTLFSNSITTVDLSGWTFSNWGGQGETISIIGHLDEANTLTGSSQNDIITGGDFNDILDGGAGDDVLNGGDGNDTFIASEGADTIDGGSNSLLFGDLIDYSASTAGINIVIDGVTAGIGGLAEGDILSDIERVTGTDFNDVIHAEIGGVFNDIFGGAGNDTLFLGDRNGSLFGEDGNDILVIDADLENQSFRTLSGGSGTDTVRLQASVTEIFDVSSNLVSIEVLEFDALAADVDLSLLITDDDFGHLSGEALSVRGDNASGSTETIIIDMTDTFFPNSFTTVDLSGWTFTNWGGQGETISIIGHLDVANTLTGSSQNDIITGGDLSLIHI